jgi:hypothetical protein
MEVDKKSAGPPYSVGGAITMLYDIFAVVGVVVILGTIVGVLWAGLRVTRPPR